jgi:hypothetical protein
MAKTFEQIATTTLSSATGKIQFTSLGSYTDFHLVATYETTSAANVYITLNNDYSTSAYYAIYLWGNGTTTLTGAQGTVYTNNPNTLGSGEFVTDVVEVYGYKDTDKYKTMNIRHACPSNLVTSVIQGTYKSSSAITSIEYNATSTFAVGTIISLYGVTMGSA